MPGFEERMRLALRGLAEPLLVLVLALLVTVALTQPFVPTRIQLEFPLRPVPEATATPHPYRTYVCTLQHTRFFNSTT